MRITERHLRGLIREQIEEEIEEARELVNHMFRDVDAWLENARAESFVVLAPF